MVDSNNKYFNTVLIDITDGTILYLRLYSYNQFSPLVYDCECVTTYYDVRRNKFSIFVQPWDLEEFEDFAPLTPTTLKLYGPSDLDIGCLSDFKKEMIRRSELLIGPT